MLKESMKLLKKIETNGFEAYVVGGFVRDHYLDKKSLDVDICTDATPSDLIKIFKDASMPATKYGAVTIVSKNIRFELTTFRKEIRYKNRKPIEVEYIDDLLEDLKRRDFTINTLCMNSKGEIIDLLNGKNDIEEKIIRTIGDPDIKLKDDALRILRAVRFGTILNFKLDNNLKASIVRNRKLVASLSYNRKKEELTRIFANTNVKYGIDLIKELKLVDYLELSNFDKLKIVDDILGMWAQVDVLNKYPFNSTEKDIISKVQEILTLPNIDSYTLYKYGLYVVSIAASIKEIDKKEVISIYDNLAIKSRNEIDVKAIDLCNLLKKDPGKWIKNLYDDLEHKIVYGELLNENKILIDYIINKKERHTLE